MRDRLLKITGGAALAPLVVLFGLNLVDELDRIAFTVFAPEIGDTFDLKDSRVIVIATLVGIASLLVVLPISFLADRYDRVKIVGLAALSWMSLSVLTGLAGWAGLLGLLIAARLGAGIGRAVNEPVHASLLPDYYEPDALPAVYTVHRMANPISAVTAILIGAMGLVVGWQAVFILLAIPTALLIASTFRLPHPRRGALVDADLALEDEAEGALSFGAARRELFAIKTLRRLYLGGFLLGWGLFPLASFTIFFFKRVFDFGSFERGVVTFIAGAGLGAGLLIGNAVTSRYAAGRPERYATLTGLSFMLAGGGLVLMSVSPVAPIALLMVFIANIGFAAYQPAYFTLVALIVPARVRTQAFGYSLILLAIGGLLSAGIFGGIADQHGYRVAIGLLSGIVALAGAMGLTSAKFVAGDMARVASARAAALGGAFSDDGSGALLVCRGVEVAYDQVQVLFGVDMDVRPGEVVALLGTNGAGKSTLLKAISGTVDPIGGAIRFDGQDITHLEGAQTTALGAIQVPGGKAVFPTLTVAEHLRAAGWLYRKDPEYLKEANEEVLRIFPRLRERIDQMAGNLSGGEQQMLALGMAFIAKPKLLMIDELSLGLAPAIVEQLLGIVRRIQEGGTAIILVEQSINVALTVADRAYFLEKGEVRFEGPTDELLERNDIVRSVFLEGGGSKAKATDKGKVAAVARRTAPTELEPILVLDDVTMRFGGITAVDDTSFTLNRGEILGLIGPNGAGKTTIFDLVSGFLIPSHGRITFDGHDITAMPPDRRAWLGLGRSFQDARLAGSLTVAENVAIGLERHLDVRDHLASMLNLPGVQQQEEDVAWTVADLIELMHLGAYRDKFVRELSTGTRRIVDLAMCMAHDPQVLLLDEPSSGIAQAETEALGPLLERIQIETGCALLVIEHDMPLITGVSDRMIALELGHPLAEGRPAEVIAHPRVVESYLGGDPATINRSGRAGAPASPALRRRPTNPRLTAAANGTKANGTKANGTKKAATATKAKANGTKPKATVSKERP